MVFTMPMQEPVPNFLESHRVPLMIIYGLPAFQWKRGLPMSFHSGGQAMAMPAGREMYL